MQNKFKKLGISMVSFFMILTGFMINVGADNSEVYHNDDMSVVVLVEREVKNEGINLSFNFNTSEEVVINDIKLNNDSTKNGNYSYSYLVGENGNYKFIVELTRSVLIEEENEQTKIIERQETFEFSVDVDEIENIEESVQVDSQELTSSVIEEETGVVEDTTEKEAQSNTQEIKGITVSVLENGTKILSSIPNQEDLDLFITENEYVSVDNENGVISIRDKNPNDVVTSRSMRTARATANNVTHGNKVVQAGDTITVTWRENRSYYWQIWGGISELFVNGERAYCLEPSVIDIVATSNASSTSLDSVNGVLVHPDGRLAFTPTTEQKRNIELISNYGYKYPGHQTAKYEWATKKLIWNEMGWDVSGGPNVDAEMNTIKNLIANHNVKPTWDGQTRQVKVGDVIELSENGLDKFVIDGLSTNGIEIVEFTGNTLKVKVTDKNARLGLMKKGGSEQGTSYVYSDGRSQKVASLRLLDPVMSLIKFEAKTGNLEITKKGTDGNFYAGVEFELSTDKNTILGTYTTDANGKVTVSDLQEGTYFVREKSVPKPLLIDTEWKQVTITGGQTTSFTAINNLTSINIFKVDKNTGEPIPNTVFNVYDKNMNLIETVTTDDSGVARVEGYEFGTYYIEEMEVPAPYVINPENSLAILELSEENNHYDIEFKNEKAVAQIQINKTDEKTVKGVAGATYVVYNAENLTIDQFINNFEIVEDELGNIVEMVPLGHVMLPSIYVGEMVTDEYGYAKMDNLPLGRYLIMEKDSPFGYQIDENVYEVNFEYADQETSLITTMLNVVEKRTKVLISGVKMDSLTKQVIKSNDFELTLKDINGNIVPVHEFKDGIHTWVVDALDTYFLSETKAPLGYLLSSEIVEINTSEKVDNNIYTIEYLNAPKPATSLPGTGVESSLNMLPLLMVLLGILLVMVKKNSESLELVTEAPVSQERNKKAVFVNHDKGNVHTDSNKYETKEEKPMNKTEQKKLKE